MELFLLTENRRLVQAGNRTFHRSHSGAAGLNRLCASIGQTVPYRYCREVMLVTLSGRLRRQEEWYRKIMIL